MSPLLRLSQQGRAKLDGFVAEPPTLPMVLEETAVGRLIAECVLTRGGVAAEWPGAYADAVPRFALNLAAVRLPPEEVAKIDGREALLRHAPGELAVPQGTFVLRRGGAAAGGADEQWRPYAQEEGSIEQAVRRGSPLQAGPAWVEPVSEGAESHRVERWWIAAEHDPDAFELGAIACRLGADDKTLPWRAKDLLAKEVQRRLPPALAPYLELLVVHGRSIEEKLLESILRDVGGDGAASALGTLLDLGIVKRLKPMMTLLAAGFSCQPDVARQRRGQLADACVRIATGGIGPLRPSAILEAHRHLAAIEERRYESLEFASFGVHELIAQAVKLSLGASDAANVRDQYRQAAALFDAVDVLARRVHADRVRAYAVHYSTYNRAKAGDLDRRKILSGYRRSVVLWPDNGLFWQRNIKALAFGDSYEIEDLAAAQAAIAEAKRSLPEQFFESYLLVRLAEDLADRRRIELLLPLFLPRPEGPRVARVSENSPRVGATVRRLWLRGDQRLGFRQDFDLTWRYDHAPRVWWVSVEERGENFDRFTCSESGQDVLRAYEALANDVLDRVERSLCEPIGARSFDLDIEWMRAGAPRSRWIVALHELRGVANENAPALRRLRESMLASMRTLDSSRPVLDYDQLADRVELRWVSPDSAEGLLIVRWQGDHDCEVQWIQDGVPRGEPPLLGPTAQWLRTLRRGVMPAAETARAHAELHRIAKHARPGAAIFRLHVPKRAAVKDMHEREVFGAEECSGHEVFFVDQYPGYGWSHPCSYVVLGREPAADRLVQRHWPPRSMSDWTFIEEFAP